MHPCNIGTWLSKQSACLRRVSRIDALGEHADAAAGAKAVAEAKHGYLLIQR